MIFFKISSRFFSSGGENRASLLTRGNKKPYVRGQGGEENKARRKKSRVYQLGPFTSSLTFHLLSLSSTTSYSSPLSHTMSTAAPSSNSKANKSVKSAVVPPVGGAPAKAVHKTKKVVRTSTDLGKMSKRLGVVGKMSSGFKR
jgi:hypothetical protein